MSWSHGGGYPPPHPHQQAQQAAAASSGGHYGGVHTSSSSLQENGFLLLQQQQQQQEQEQQRREQVQQHLRQVQQQQQQQNHHHQQQQQQYGGFPFGQQQQQQVQVQVQQQASSQLERMVMQHQMQHHVHAHNAGGAPQQQHLDQSTMTTDERQLRYQIQQHQIKQQQSQQQQQQQQQSSSTYLNNYFQNQLESQLDEVHRQYREEVVGAEIHGHHAHSYHQLRHQHNTLGMQMGDRGQEAEGQGGGQSQATLSQYHNQLGRPEYQQRQQQQQVAHPYGHHHHPPLGDNDAPNSLSYSYAQPEAMQHQQRRLQHQEQETQRFQQHQAVDRKAAAATAAPTSRAAPVDYSGNDDTNNHDPKERSRHTTNDLLGRSHSLPVEATITGSGGSVDDDVVELTNSIREGERPREGEAEGKVEQQTKEKPRMRKPRRRASRRPMPGTMFRGKVKGGLTEDDIIVGSPPSSTIRPETSISASTAGSGKPPLRKAASMPNPTTSHPNLKSVLDSMPKRRSRRGTAALTHLAESIIDGKSTVVITGAGLSVGSGIRPFRGKDGLWGTVVWTKATRESFRDDPLAWYNDFWLQHFPPSTYEGTYRPNLGHEVIAKLANLDCTDVKVITQNVDGLHSATAQKWDWGSRLVEAHGRLGLYKCIPESDSDTDSDSDHDEDRPVKLGNLRKTRALRKAYYTYGDGAEVVDEAEAEEEKKAEVEKRMEGQEDGGETVGGSPDKRHRSDLDAMEDATNDDDVENDDNDIGGEQAEDQDENDEPKNNEGKEQKKKKKKDKPRVICRYELEESFPATMIEPEQLRRVMLGEVPRDDDDDDDEDDDDRDIANCEENESLSDDGDGSGTSIGSSSFAGAGSDACEGTAVGGTDNEKERKPSAAAGTTRRLSVDRSSSSGGVGKKRGGRRKRPPRRKRSRRDDSTTSKRPSSVRLTEPPQCPECLCPCMPQALLFDEGYHAHDFYQFERMERWIADADVLIFVGTSFQVTITDVALEHARERGVPVFNFNVDAKGTGTLESTARLNAENVVGDVGETLPMLWSACWEEMTMRGMLEDES